MKKSFLMLACILLAGVLSSFVIFNEPKNTKVFQTSVSADVLDLGYFTIGSQEYHAYGNPASGSQITQLWATDNSSMTDSVQITTFSGTWSGNYGPTSDLLGVTVTFQFNGRKSYSGPVYY